MRMPSASSKPEKPLLEGSDAMKQALQVIEKKVRNLEKRKGKLDVYKQKKDSGEQLNADQQEAISRYDGVLQNLEFACELQKQFQGICNDAEKIQKKLARKEAVEKQKQDIKKIRDLLLLQNTLDLMGSESAREDFLNGSHGAVKLTAANLDQLDEFYKLVNPTRQEGDDSYTEQLMMASEHLVYLMDGKDKEITSMSVTYKELKDVLEQIQACGYFEKTNNQGSTEEKSEEAEKEDLGNEKDLPTFENLRDTTEEKKEEREDSSPSEPIMQDIVVPDVSALTIQSIDPEITNTTQVMATKPAEPITQQQEEVKAMAIQDGEEDEDEDEEFNPEDDSFFTTQPFPRQRPFQEIVSSVQGTFNFLQDSEIELESSPHIDPAVVAAQPMARSQNLPSGDSVAPRPQGDNRNVSSLISQSGGRMDAYSSSSRSAAAYSQSYMSGSAPPTSHMALDQDLPSSIQMPNANQIQGMDSHQNMEDKKVFQMNPNAAMFHSMYGSGNGNQSGSNGHQDMQSSQQYNNRGQMDDEAKNQDYNPSQGDVDSGYGYNARNNHGYRGSGRGGRGNNRGMGSNGMPRSGRGGAPFGGNRGGNFNSRGGSRGGPRGGQSARGSGNMRNGVRSGFGVQRPPSNQQQAV